MQVLVVLPPAVTVAELQEANKPVVGELVPERATVPAKSRLVVAEPRLFTVTPICAEPSGSWKLALVAFAVILKPLGCIVIEPEVLAARVVAVMLTFNNAVP